MPATTRHAMSKLGYSTSSHMRLFPRHLAPNARATASGWMARQDTQNQLSLNEQSVTHLALLDQT